MTTLISHYSGGGRCVGRCDTRCHDARGPICRCICGGRFHGMGFAQAQYKVKDDGVQGALLWEAGAADVELRKGKEVV